VNDPPTDPPGDYNPIETNDNTTQNTEHSFTNSKKNNSVYYFKKTCF
jgi:hypothetical protein